jgi:hypothetical protein
MRSHKKRFEGGLAKAVAHDADFQWIYQTIERADLCPQQVALA